MKYKFSVVRFVPDVVRGEFVNVGIIAGSDDSSEWELRTVDNAKRARQLDDRGLLPLVWNVFDDLGRKLDRYTEDVANGEVAAGQADVSFEWLKKLSIESHNVVQFSEPSIIVADQLDLAMEILFNQYVLEPQSQQAHKFLRKNSALAAVRQAYKQVGFSKDQQFLEAAAVKGNHHKERFDFIVANGSAVQLTQAWSFQNPDQVELSEKIKAWAWTVHDIREHGGSVVSEERTVRVPSNVDIEVVYIPPVDGASSEILEEAKSAFDEVEVKYSTMDAANAVAARASEKLQAAH